MQNVNVTWTFESNVLANLPLHQCNTKFLLMHNVNLMISTVYEENIVVKMTANCCTGKPYGIITEITICIVFSVILRVYTLLKIATHIIISAITLYCLCITEIL